MFDIRSPYPIRYAFSGVRPSPGADVAKTITAFGLSGALELLKWLRPRTAAPRQAGAPSDGRGRTV
jgi:hypothetical protein